jgi:hypothetical protein
MAQEDPQLCNHGGGLLLARTRTHTHTHTRTSASGLGDEVKRPAIHNFEPRTFLNLYKIAHSESSVDKWNNFRIQASPHSKEPTTEESVRASQEHCKFTSRILEGLVVRGGAVEPPERIGCEGPARKGGSGLALARHLFSIRYVWQAVAGRFPKLLARFDFCRWPVLKKSPGI